VAITPEQVKNQEFPVRIKGYEPEAVRRFLVEVAAAYRATIRDQGAQWALANISDDLAAVLRAAHNAAEKVMTHAEADAAEVRQEADHEADTRLAAAEVESIQLLRDARGEAEVLRHEAEEQARTLRERSEAQADAIRRQAEADGRRILAESQARAEQARHDCEEETRRQIDSVLADASARIDELQATERVLEERIRTIHEEFQQLARRMGPGTTIDLTADRPVVIVEERFELPDDIDDPGPDPDEAHEAARARAVGRGSSTGTSVEQADGASGAHDLRGDGHRGHDHNGHDHNGHGHNGHDGNGHAPTGPADRHRSDTAGDRDVSDDELTQFVRDLQLGSGPPTSPLAAHRPGDAGGRVDPTTVQRMVSAAVDRALAHS
jgi:DivIVA domain-containing protein